MTDNTTTNFDFNNFGGQRSFDVIPAHTICVLQMTIRRGGGADNGWLRPAHTEKGDSEGLDCEFTVVGGPHNGRKLWQLYTIRGSSHTHDEAGKISGGTLRAILESAHGINPDDKSEAAQNKRKPSGWADFDQLRFVARLGVQPPQGNFQAKNTILQVITPDLVDWQKHKPEQISASDKAANAAAAAAPTTPPANAVARPVWGQGR